MHACVCARVCAFPPSFTQSQESAPRSLGPWAFRLSSPSPHPSALSLRALPKLPCDTSVPASPSLRTAAPLHTRSRASALPTSSPALENSGSSGGGGRGVSGRERHGRGTPGQFPHGQMMVGWMDRHVSCICSFILRVPGTGCQAHVRPSPPAPQCPCVRCSWCLPTRCWQGPQRAADPTSLSRVSPPGPTPPESHC